MSFTLIDNQNRKELNEGRVWQMGFAFCKKTGENEYTTIQPISTCKDYLNDVVYSELTGNPFEAHGLKTKKEGIFEGVDSAYLVISILSTPNGGWPSNTSIGTKKENVARLRDNIGNIKKALNFVEEKLEPFGCVGRTEIASNGDYHLLSVPLYWCQSTHLISLYSLIVRMSQFWDGEGEAHDFLNNYEITLDRSIWRDGAKDAYNRILKNGIKIVHPSELENEPHDEGILSYRAYYD